MRLIMFIVPAAAGVALLIYVQAGRGDPERIEPGERTIAVRVVPVESIRVRPRALAFGDVAPGESWSAVSQVSGEVVERHAGLKAGAVIDAGQVLFRIDPARYELDVARAEAQLERADADLAELRQSEENARAVLEIERQTLALARNDYERNRTLRARGTISEAALEDSERRLNQARARVRELENELALIPARRKVLEAQKAGSRTDLRLARLELERTTVRAPFTGRVASEVVTVGQVVNRGENVATMDSVDQAEIEAELPIQRMITLLNAERFDEIGELSEARIREALGAVGVEAKVRFRSGDLAFEWGARLVRLRAGLDPVARTVGVVVAVDDPYAEARPGRRPPLIKNMYVEVELTGPPRGPLNVVPRDAVHRGTVLIADAEDRLERRPVTVALEQGGFAAISEGLAPGDRVIVSLVEPAIAGQKLAVEVDTDLRDRLRARAAGKGPVR